MVGKTVSHYQIIEKLGSGGMGVVYKAQDLRLDRFVALKFLPQDIMAGEEDRQRFIQEAKAASALDHTNICAIHEIDQTDDGQMYIVMAYYEGETLEDKIKEERLKIKDVIEYVTQVASGLNNAHKKGIVHRDIKPANIMITGEGIVKILDFGVAKLPSRAKLTRKSTTLGTLSYVSPEQTRGGDVDNRADIWSLGVIIYEMLTGQMPFKGEYDSAVIYSILHDTHKPATSLRPDVPLFLERIIDKCLMKDPAERYQQVDELIRDLQQADKNAESPGRQITQPQGMKRFRPFILFVSSLVVVGLFLIGYFLLRPDETGPSGWENSIAVLPFDNLSNDPEQQYFCDGMTEQIISNLAKLPNLKVISRTSVMNYKKADKTIPEIGKDLNVAHILEGSVRKFGDRLRVTAQLIRTGDDAYIWTENYDREYKELFDVQDDVSEAIATSLLINISSREITGIKTRRPANTEAYEYYMKGRYFHYSKYWGATIDQDYFKRSEQMFLKAIDLDPTYALSYADLADLYNTYCRTTLLSEPEYRNYLALQRKYLDKALALDSNLAEVQIIKSWIHQEYNEIESAYTSIRKALELNPNDAYANSTMARFLHARGLMEQAHEYFEKAIEMDPVQPMHYAWNGYCLTMLGNYQESENNLKRALEIDPDHFVSIVNYILLLITEGRYEYAQELLGKYFPVYGQNINMIGLRALLFAIDGDRERALKIYPEGLYYKYYIYAVLNMFDEAVDYLNTVYTSRWAKIDESRYIEFNSNPLLQNLRTDPRFQEILLKHQQLFERNLIKYGDKEIL